MKRLVSAILIMLMVFSAAVCTPAYADKGSAKVVGRDWGKLMTLPSEKAIAAFNKTSKERSPYIAAWMDTGSVGSFTQIAVDFKADYLPLGTYCSLASFDLDYSALNAQYRIVKTNHVAGYAGFQRNTEANRYNAIMSFWEVNCYEASYKKTIVNARLIAPEGEKEGYFTSEGDGTNYLPDYPWKAQHWYRFLIQCGKNEKTGNTTVEYWVKDLEANTWTRLCIFDLGVPNVTFKGNTSVFLENFVPASAGDIRTLEFCNFRVMTTKGDWVSIESGTFEQNYDYPGSYRYGSDGKCFWIITSGIPKLAAEQKSEKLTVKNSETGSPF